MADCTKTVEFLREWDRMCTTTMACKECRVSSFNNGYNKHCVHFRSENIDEAIAIVQKWSDEHPVLTWEGKLRELLRHADVGLIIKTCCPGAFFEGAPMPKSKRTFCPYLSDGCAKCWNGEYKEEDNG